MEDVEDVVKVAQEGIKPFNNFIPHPFISVQCGEINRIVYARYQYWPVNWYHPVYSRHWFFKTIVREIRVVWMRVGKRVVWPR